MHHKMTSRLTALTLLCLLILAVSWLTYPQPVEGLAYPEYSTPSQLAQGEPIEGPPHLANDTAALPQHLDKHIPSLSRYDILKVLQMSENALTI